MRDAKLNDLRVLNALMKGIARLSVSENTVVGETIRPHHIIKRLTDRGVIVGAVPLLSEEGKAYYEALKALYPGER